MVSNKTTPKNIDEYIAGFPADVQEKLQRLRKIIQQAAPDAGEKISYGMPTFTLKGHLLHFAAYKKHIGFYPTPSGIVKFEKELSAYKNSKGAVQFPIDQPIPYKLVAKIVALRVGENLAKAEKKAKPGH